jgi:hypothetical protein
VCDSVINFEVVLSSGDIVQANATSFPDLYVALKGGSNNFGIVTRFDFTTFPQGQMYGGAIGYNTTIANTAVVNSFYKALADFTSDPNGDENATIASVVGFSQSTGLLLEMDVWHTSAETNSPSLAPFAEIQPQTRNTLHFDSLTGFAEVQVAEVPAGQRQGWYTISTKPDTQLLLDIHDLYLAIAKNLSDIEPDISFNIEHCPVRQSYINASLAKGPNVLGSGVPTDCPYIIYLFSELHHDPASDDKVADVMRSFIEQIRTLSTSRGLGQAFTYLNYADRSQDGQIMEGYGKENVAKLKAASLKYDPSQFFQRVVPGGIKIDV